MQLIPNWRSALRMYSIQAQTINLAGIAAWQALPDKWQDAVPPSVLLGLVAVFLTLGIVGRLIVQPGVSKDAA